MIEGRTYQKPLDFSKDPSHCAINNKKFIGLHIWKDLSSGLGLISSHLLGEKFLLVLSMEDRSSPFPAAQQTMSLSQLRFPVLFQPVPWLGACNAQVGLNQLTATLIFGSKSYVQHVS